MARRSRPALAKDERRATLEARAPVGAALRRALGQLGIDPARVAMLRVCDAAAAELAAPADARGAKTPPAAAEDAHAAAAPAQLAARLARLGQRYRDAPDIDFAHASLAEILAWCTARLPPRDGQPASFEASLREAPQDKGFHNIK
jgi:hypothetical protein